MKSDIEPKQATAATSQEKVKKPRLSGKVPKPPQRKKTTRKKSKKKTRKRAPRMPISPADVKRLAFEYPSLAQADQQAGTTEPLVDVLAAHPKLLLAWGRGELLRRLKACADVLDNVHDVARELKFTNGQEVREWFDSDDEAHDLWLQTRFVTRKAAMSAMVQAAMEGNQRAIQVTADKLDEDRQATTQQAKDWFILTLKQVEEITGKHRKTVFNWRKESGMPSMGSGAGMRVDLRKFVPWFEDYVTKLLTKGIKPSDPTSPLQQRKIRHLDMEYKRQVGDLIERGQVIGWQVAQIQNIITAFAKIPDLVNLLFSQPREQIAQILADFQDEIILKMQKIPDMLSLDDVAMEKLSELYLALRAIDEESDGEVMANRS